MLSFMNNPIVQKVIIAVIGHFVSKALEWIAIACKEKFVRDIIKEIEKQEKEQKENENKKRKLLKRKNSSLGRGKMKFLLNVIWWVAIYVLISASCDQRTLGRVLEPKTRKIISYILTALVFITTLVM